jgi:DCC1-like thiol-disulfide oxidoreductase
MYWSMKMLLSILVAVILLEGVAAFVSLSRRPSFCLSPVKVASFDLNPRIKPSTVKLVTQIDLLYDSECPLCAMEVEFLKKRDYENKIRFTDLSSLDYNPSDHGDVKFSDGMRKIRAILPDTNEVVTGVEVFRHVYRYLQFPSFVV